MTDIKRIRTTQRIRWGLALMIFVGINLVVRGLLLPLNEAEYTDGVIQLTQFQELSGIYPPLYTLITWPFSLIFGQLWAGRIVSWLFSTAAVIPLFLLARRSFGMRAAVFSAIVYTVAPVSLRWATRVMTESQFCFFFWFACERLIAAQGAKDRKSADRALVLANVFGVLASLTRYQGLLLIFPVLAIAVYNWRKRGWFPTQGVLSLALYGLIPLWSAYAGNIHGDQFMDRTAILGPWMTFVLSAEPFLLYIPFFLTYPVFILMTIGINVGNSRKRYLLTPLTIYVLLVLLIFQSLFSSFQERYFLPLYGLLFLWAGLGMAVVDDRCRRKYPRLRPYTPIVVVSWSLFMSAIVLIGGRQVFGDVRAASQFSARILEEQNRGTIYTNEIYRQERDDSPAIAATKVEFFAQRDAEYLEMDYYTGALRLQSGDIVVLTSRDDPGNQYFALSEFNQLEELQTFESVVIPVFPDIMQQRSVEQSPAAWLYRYIPQQFSTTVYRVR